MSRTRVLATWMTAIVAAILAASVPISAYAAPQSRSLSAARASAAHQASYATTSACVQYHDGQHCNGTDPYDTGCAGSGASYYVVQSLPLEYQDDPNNASWSYGYVQLWWSDTCRTNWTRTVASFSPVNQTYAYVEAGGVPEDGPRCYCADTHSPQVNGWEIPATASGWASGEYQYLWYERTYSQ